MKNVRTVLAIALSLLLVFAVVACDNNKKTEDTTAEVTTAEVTTEEATTLSPELTAEEALEAYKKALVQADKCVLAIDAEVKAEATVSGVSSSSTVKMSNKTVFNGSNFSATVDMAGVAAQYTFIDGTLYVYTKVENMEIKQMAKVPAGKEAEVRKDHSAEIDKELSNVKAVSGKRLDGGSLELTVTDAGDAAKYFSESMGAIGAEISSVEITVKVNADGTLNSYVGKVSYAQSEEGVAVKGEINYVITADYKADTTVKAPDDAASYEEQKWEDIAG